MSLLSIPYHGYYVEYSGELDHGPYKHFFCGEHNIPGATCPNCEKPLLRTLNLGTSDPRLEITDSPFPMLPLLFCWVCAIQSDPPFLYRIEDDGGVMLLRHGTGFEFEKEDQFPYPDYPTFFPGRPALLNRVPAEEEEAMRWNEDAEHDESLEEKYEPIVDGIFDRWAVHQVGGVPMLVQFAPNYDCPTCKERMPLLSTIADDNTSERGFTDNSGIQMLFSYCRKCHVVAACCDSD